MTFRVSGDKSVSGDVLPVYEGMLASVTLERQGSGFPRLTANFTAQLDSFSPFPHFILLFSLLCGIFQHCTTSFPPTQLSYFVPASLLNTKLHKFFLALPLHLIWYHEQVFTEVTNQQHPLGNPVFVHSCHMPHAATQSRGCNQIFQELSHAKIFHNLHTT